jgi:uncharacterized small protein (DUF1192 family)
VGAAKGNQRCVAAAVRSLVAIAKLEKRIAALEAEVTGPPAEVLLEQSKDFLARSEARWAAIREYSQLQREATYKAVPWVREVEEKERANFSAFMRERGFDP